MNTSSLKAYAPQARTEFIRAVTDCAGRFGLSKKKIEPVTVEGDVAVINGVAHPSHVAEQRAKLEERIASEGFDQVMEAVAYTWFNRFAAIRYMELHGYLDHGYRVLSHPAGSEQPEIIEHAADVDLPGLDRNRVVDLKLDGTKDDELYRLLLLAQCNALHQAMPFLFEEVGAADELLLPANLLHTDSLIRQLVEQVDEVLWQDIEIIGWLYQFYISEKKDQVIGKVVKSEDIPAATQLFTPNWIVKYMVQNSLGAQWLATYPQSPLKAQMEYYIEPAEQTAEVKAQLAAITPSTLNPEELTLIDPASGSGHILVEAYELFKAIYLERGYQKRDVPQLILEKNLFGLDIDERAAQLTGFALMMKGRADDRRLFERGVQLNVMALVDSAGFDAEALAKGVELGDYGLKPGDLTELKRLFEHATTFGSLIQVPEGLAEKLPALKQLSEVPSQDLFVSEALKRLGPLVQQAALLAAHYDAVVANPPYMGNNAYCGLLKTFVNDSYKAGRADLYGAFMLRNVEMAKKGGQVGMITTPNWMFLTSFENLRHAVFQNAPISSLVHNGRGVWGPDFGSCSFVLRRSAPERLSGRFLRLSDKQGSVSDNEELERRFHVNSRFSTSNVDFNKVPGSPIAFWVSDRVRQMFSEMPPLLEHAEARQGLCTTDNDRFTRLWPEVSASTLGLDCTPEIAEEGGRTWFPFNKGGQFRRWYGNHGFVVNWRENGRELKSFIEERYVSASKRVVNEPYYFRPSVSWSDVTSAANSFRAYPAGFIHGNVGHSAFGGDEDWRASLLAYANTKFVNIVAELLSPTLHLDVGTFSQFPYAEKAWTKESASLAKRCVRLGARDWNAYERSWDFQSLPLLTASSEPMPSLESSYTAWITQNRDTIAEMKRLEEENNRLFIDAYGLADELTPDVPIEQITLTVNPAYRYGGKLTEEEQWTRFRQDTMEELVSYAIGNMMGRYSLDAPGLIYALSGNEGFDSGRYSTFPTDDDGIVPLTDTEWFDDEAATRVVEFMSVAWDAADLEENLSFLADNLSPKRNESSRDTLRRYLCDSFFKNHLQTYKKRPIYWLFSSGKQKAFQCLVYLHRYNDGTLARMRTEYAIPLQGKISAQIDRLDDEIGAATNTSQRKKLEKQRDKFKKQREELRKFDEKLRHYADKRIALDLDDGVKVNYGKFGDLLANVKDVTGKKAEVE